jgi:Pyruvate/2-oxoglutarate dehydrogenase complex, dihydrolipoamide acyltransferase (E2) component, and related enzymes
VQLNDEIQAAVAQPVEHEGNYVLGSGANRLLLKLGAAMPQGLRLFIMRNFILNNPKRMNDMMGSVMVTSLGTLGQISGWIIPTSMHPLSIGIGTINKKEVFIAGKIGKRSILHLTLAFDHDVIDGMQALKFVDDLVSALERGVGV